MYAGQGLGAALGGVVIAQGQMPRLHEIGLVLMGLAMGLSVWSARCVAASHPDQKRT